MWLSRRSLLAGVGGLGAAAMLPTLSRAARAQGARRLVVVLADGGWDTSMVFDPKLGVAGVDGPEVDEVAGNPDDVNELTAFGDITLCTNEGRRPAVSRFFEKWADRCVVVNGLLVGSIVHDFGRYRILTGTQVNTNPDLATIAGFEHGANLPLGSVDTSGLSLSGTLGTSAGRLGARNQIGYLLDGTQMPAPLPSMGISRYPQFTPDLDEQALLEEFVVNRLTQQPTTRAGMQAQVDAMIEATTAACLEHTPTEDELACAMTALSSAAIKACDPTAEKAEADGDEKTEG